MIRFTQEEADRIKGGDIGLLRDRLLALDADLTKRLKYYKEDLGVLQGAAQVTDSLLKILQ